MDRRFESFERYFVGIVAITVGLDLIAFSLMGSLWLHIIHYRTSPSAIYQLVGQDIVNLAILAPLCLLGGVLRIMNRPMAKYLLIMTPLYLVYTALSYGMGMEWGHPAYTGNSEDFFFLFLWLMIGGFTILFDSLGSFAGFQGGKPLRRTVLVPYSVIFGVFLVLFAMMWLSEVGQVIDTGTSRGYSAAPVAFWVVRYFDLGFTIPLGFISIYLLWSRPRSSFPVQMLFYGFFLTMGLGVNAMGLSMRVMGDPDWTLEGTVIFGVLFIIILAGFLTILRTGRTHTTHTAGSSDAGVSDAAG